MPSNLRDTDIRPSYAVVASKLAAVAPPRLEILDNTACDTTDLWDTWEVMTVI